MEDSIENNDFTDGLGDTIKEICQSILDEFKDLIGKTRIKKSFIGGLVKFFLILLSLKVTSLTKIIKTRTKSTARRLREPGFLPAPGQWNGNKNIMNRRHAMFKIKTLLSQTKQVKVKKMAKL